jgi:HSP20 family protein
MNSQRAASKKPSSLSTHPGAKPMAKEAKKQQPKKTPARSPAKRSENPLDALRAEVDRLFEDFTRVTWPRLPNLWGKTPVWSSHWEFSAPAVDVAEKDGLYEITVELPGMDEKDIELNLSDNILTIRGENREEKEEKEEKETRLHVSERYHGMFERSFTLPDGVDADKISAAFDKGVLTISLPKSEEAKAKQRKIAIKSK